MALTDSLRILITANGAQAEREFAKVGATARRELGRAEVASERWGRTLTSAGVAMATFGGVALVGLYKAAQAAQEEDLAIAKLNNSIANSTELAGASADAFLEQAAALQDTTRFADDATIGVQALLGQFSLTQDQILQLTPLVLDLSSKMGISLEAAAKAVGRATQGTAGGLSRMIGQFDAGDSAAESFANTVQALSSRVGGFAETEGATFNGQMEILKNNLGDVAESIGRGAVDGFNRLLGPVMAVSDAFQSLDPATQSTVGTIATFGAAGLTAAGAVSFLAGQVLTAADRFKTLATAANFAKLGVAGLTAAALAAGYQFGQTTEEVDLTNRFVEEAGRLAVMSAADMAELAEQIERASRIGGEFDLEEMFRAMLEVGPAGVAGVQRMADALIDAGYDADVVQEALWELRGAAYEASGGMDEVAGASERAGDAAGRLGRQWNGLSNRLTDFGATLDAQDALYGLRDSLAAAQEEGGITGQEMVNLNRDLVRLIDSQVRVAEAQATAADGTVNYARRNRILRTNLGALASFIPAVLRPQFQRLTDDVTRTGDAAREVPDRVDIVTTLTGEEEVIDGLRRIHLEAQAAADAVGQTGGSLAGGGSYGGPRSAPRSQPRTRTDDMKQAFREALREEVQMVHVTNSRMAEVY